MKKSSGNYFFYFLIIIAIVTLGFIREHFFVNLNYQLGKLYYLEFHNSSDYNYQLPRTLSVFGTMSYHQLYWCKWLLSGIFALAYLIITYITIRRLFPDIRGAIKITLWTHAALLIIAILFFLYGYIPGNSEKGYSLSLVFMHMLQSPVVLMLLVPAFKLARMSREQGS